MNEEKSEKIRTVLENVFRHSDFRSNLQKEAIEAVVIGGFTTGVQQQRYNDR